MNCSISCGNFTGDILNSEHSTDSVFKRGYINFKMMSVHGKVTSVQKLKFCDSES